MLGELLALDGQGAHEELGANLLALGLLIGALVGLGTVLVGMGRPRRSPPAAPRPPAPARAPSPQPVSLAQPARATGPFVRPRFGEWRVADVEQLLAEQGSAFPERREELEVYLDSFRDVAYPDGRLPGDVDLVIEDVFAPLIERAGQGRDHRSPTNPPGWSRGA